MRKKNLLFTSILLLLLFSMIFSAFSESAEAFSFRNGISFGMSEEQIKETEAKNDQVPQDSWEIRESDIGRLLISKNSVKLSSTTCLLAYWVTDDQMEAALYTSSYLPTPETYELLTTVLSSDYGDYSPASSDDIIQLLKIVIPYNSFPESGISSANKWEKENIIIYQCLLYESSFLILYINPSWDYPYTDISDSTATTGQ